MDEIRAMLQYAAGVASPIRLQMRSPSGDISVHEIVGSSCLIGRSDDCDISIPDDTVAFRHVYLQAIGNRLAVVPLPSAAGVQCVGADFTGWFGVDHRMQICGYTLQLLDTHWATDGDLPSPTAFRPRDEQRPEYGLLPTVDLELLNTSARGRKWPINRVITLLGRDEACRITVVDDRISRAHAAFLLLPTGLWVLDLLARVGIKVGGQDCRCALLADSVELQIGPYKLAARYPQVEAAVAAQAQQLQYGTEFLTKQNKVLLVETYQETLIVSPSPNAVAVLFQDVYVESSRVTDLMTRKYKNLVIDLDVVGTAISPHVVEALASLCRNTNGTAVLSGGHPDLHSSIKNSTLKRVWKHYPNRIEAITALASPKS
ncbi:MAG: FHA domain-containing protein [Planctomycetaceae bacterium]|nr:FHA domain-containing protein [Planctomycetaceae bacterium]MCB9953395.1 FHA domain-containing protein [Planctomycetaceae bacterium]